MSSIINRDTIGDMARRAATKYGDKTAIIFRDLKLSFYDIEREAWRFANLMTGYGIKKGDRVALYTYNFPYYAIIAESKPEFTTIERWGFIPPAVTRVLMSGI